MRTKFTQEATSELNTRKQINKNNHYIVEYVVSLSGVQTEKIYIKHQLLGRGGFANCYVTQLSGSQQFMATKIIEKNNLKSSRSRLRLVNQIKIHKTFSHPNIVQFFHHFQDYENVYIMLELCQNQSLNQLLKQRKTLTYPEVQSFIFGICNGIKYLHDKKFIHRDLKLANVFLNDKFQVKIGDFGLTSQLEFLKQNKRTICGTPNYIAPEVLQGIGYYFEVDIWGIGIIMYTLFYGYPPFQSQNTPQIYSKIKRCLYNFPKNKNVPIQAINLIRSILIPQPQKRPTIDQILNSPFMKLGPGIPLQLPQICYLRAPTKAQIQQMPLFITKPTVFKQLKSKQQNNYIEVQPQQKYKKSDNKSTIDKTISRDCNYMLTGPDYQQKCSPFQNFNLKSVNKTQQIQAKNINNMNNFDTKIKKIQQIPQHVIDFQQIDQNTSYFCTSNYVLGTFQKNKEINFRHLYDFQNSFDEIKQIKLYNNLFSEQCRVSLATYKYKALLTLKAKQLLKNLKKQNLVEKKQLNTIKNSGLTTPQKLVYISRITQHKDMTMLKLSNKCIQIIYQHEKNGFFYIIPSQQLYFYQSLNKPIMRQLVLSNIAEIVNNYQKNSEKVKKTPNILTCVQIQNSSQYVKLQIINLIHIYGIIKQLQNKKNKHCRNRNSQ